MRLKTGTTSVLKGLAVSLALFGAFCCQAGESAVDRSWPEHTRSNVLLILSTATNLAPPVTWTPVLTNHFDASGNFSVTNLYNPSRSQQCYRFSVL